MCASPFVHLLMGMNNLYKVHVYWHTLPDLPYRVLSTMAFSSMDHDRPPVYFGGWEFLADRSGRPVPERDDDDLDVSKTRRSIKRAIMAAIKILKDLRIVVVLSSGKAGQNARYALMLSPGVGDSTATHSIDA